MLSGFKKSIVESKLYLCFLPIILIGILLPGYLVSVPSRSAGQEANQESLIDSLLRAAYDFFNQEKYDLAIQSYQLLINEIEKSPDPKTLEETKAQTYLAIADCYFKLGDKDKAKQAFLDFFKLRPNPDPDPILPSEGLGVVYGEAKVEFRITTEAKPIQTEPTEIEKPQQEPVKEAPQTEPVIEVPEKPREEPKEEPKQAPQLPVVKTKPGEAGAGKKKGGSTLLLLGGLAVGGAAAVLLLAGKKESVPAGPTTGSIQVNSTPSGAKVYLDSADKGTTPLTISSVSVGSHTIRLTKENYRDYLTTVNVAGGTTTPYSFALSKHKISVTRPALNQRCKKGTTVQIAWATDTAATVGQLFAMSPAAGQISTAPPARWGVRSGVAANSKISVRAADSTGPVLRRGGELEFSNSEGPGVGGMGRVSGKERTGMASPRLDRLSRPKGIQMGAVSLPGATGEPLAVRSLIVTNVKIDLLKSGKINRTIRQSTANTGSYSWTISESWGLNDARDYKIRVSSTTDTGVYDDSEAFEIYADYGSIKVTSNPTGADVYLDSVYQSKATPCTLTNVTTGSHMVKVEKNGYYSAQRSVTVSTNHTTNVGFTLTKKAPGSLKIDSKPRGAAVYLDGIAQGKNTPCTLSNVPEGTYQLKLLLRLYGKWEGDVIVDAGRTKTVDKTLDAFKYEYITSWGSYRLNNPMGLALDDSRNIYIADMGNNMIQKYSSNGVHKKGWRGGENGRGINFKQPRWVAVSGRGSGSVFIADTKNNLIQKFSRDGDFRTKWDGSKDGKKRFNEPFGVGVDLDGYVYVSDKGNGLVRKFDESGDQKDQWPNPRRAFVEFWGIDADRAGYVYVADSTWHKIQKYTTNGAFKLEWDGYGSAGGRLNYPVGVAVDSFGCVYVTDLGNRRFVKYDSNGRYLTHYGGIFSKPEGIGVDSDGYVYVSDRADNAVYKFKISDKVEQAINTMERNAPIVNPLLSAPRLNPDRQKLVDRLNILQTEIERRREEERK